MHMKNIIDILQHRGLIEGLTGDDVRKTVSEPIKVYCGFDPTADGLHLGNMVAIMGLAWFQRLGHTPVALVGGATGMIGDPSGKVKERSLLNAEIVKHNAKAIHKDLQTILLRNSTLPEPLFLNNLDWFQDFSFIEFLRDVGIHFRVGVMLGKESVRARLQSDEGISFTEFSYQLLQAYDFYKLFTTHGVSVQIGGSDQWGNITAGMDLVKRLTGKQVYGLTMPLLLKSDGQKFGKSEKGALWLSREKLSSYDLYQQLIRTEDADVIRLLKMLTFIEMAEILKLEQEMKSDSYVSNKAQKLLASTVVELLHGEAGLQQALKTTMGLAPGKEAALDAETIKSLINHVPSQKMSKKEIAEKN